MLRSAGLKAVVETKKPTSSYKHKKARLKFALAHKDGLWRIEKGLYGQTKLKSISWDQMEENGCEKSQGKS